MAPMVRLKRKELELVKEAMERIERRTSVHLEIDPKRVEIADENEEERTQATGRGR